MTTPQHIYRIGLLTCSSSACALRNQQLTAGEMQAVKTAPYCQPGLVAV